MEDCYGTRLSILCQKECVSSFLAADEAFMIGLSILARLTGPSQPHSSYIARLSPSARSYVCLAVWPPRHFAAWLLSSQAIAVEDQ